MFDVCGALRARGYGSHQNHLPASSGVRFRHGLSVSESSHADAGCVGGVQGQWLFALEIENLPVNGWLVEVEVDAAYTSGQG